MLVTRGMVAWMAAWASLPAQAGPGAEPGRNAAAAPQAGASLSTSTPSQPAPNSEGGDASSSPACTSLPPALSPHATSEIVAVLAQMTLAHARPAPFPAQEVIPP